MLDFVVIHNPRNRKILNDAKRLNPILEQSENMKKLLQSEDLPEISTESLALNYQGPIYNARGNPIR